MKKSITNALILMGCLSIISISKAAVFTCPTLKPHELYFYYDWIEEDGNKIKGGQWNQQYWRLWINGDSYLTPEMISVRTSPLVAHFFATTNSWYLKCVSADLSVSPRNNVWPYRSCLPNADNTGFDCK